MKLSPLWYIYSFNKTDYLLLYRELFDILYLMNVNNYINEDLNEFLQQQQIFSSNSDFLFIFFKKIFLKISFIYF